MVIQAYAPTSNAEEAEVEQFYEDLQDLLELTPMELTPKKDVISSQRTGMQKTRDVFKKMRDTKGTFHAKMDPIKPRNGMDLT